MQASELGLDASTRAIADAFVAEFPGAVFTNGARNITDQARAMAQNTIAQRDWIEQTYVMSPVKAALMHWLQTNPNQRSLEQVQSGFLNVLGAFSTRELQRLSKHIVPDGGGTGARAFDVLPEYGERAPKMIAWLAQKALAYGGKFLTREGGLVRWHFQLP